MFTCLGLFSVSEIARSYRQKGWGVGNLPKPNLPLKNSNSLYNYYFRRVPVIIQKAWQKRIMGRWKIKQVKGTCWLPQWNVGKKQETAISVQFNGVFSPIHNWKCVYCFIFSLWERVTNLIFHIESQLMVLIMHWLTLFLNQKMGQSEYPGYPRLCKRTPQALVLWH